ncbi:MAG: T9SS type A sorting domain-containing protein [Flavobacteriales bacterium]|nr:T9SS type A sorting domain-containing protein [Flavobacteriales bacterium]
MKKITVILYFFINHLLLIHSQVWQPVGPNPLDQLIIDGSGSSFTDIVTDNYENPIVAFSDGSYGNKITVKKFNGTNWETIGAPGFSAGWAEWISITIDNFGIPYVSYKDLANGHKVTVMKFDGSNWQILGTPGFSTSSVYYTSIAVDNIGTPYVAFQDVGNGSKATVMKFNGSSWEAIGNMGISAGTASYTSIAVGIDNYPMLAYKDGGFSDKATVLKYNGTSWEALGIEGFSAGAIDYGNLALSDNGIPFFIYRDWANSYKATVMTFNGSNWVNVGAPGFSVGAVADPSITIDSNGFPYVHFADYGISDKSVVMKYNGSNWELVGTSGLSAGQAHFTSIALDNNDIPYIAFRDLGLAYLPIAMKFNGSNWSILGTTGISTGETNSTTIAIDDSGTPYITYLDVPNGNKVIVKKFDGYNWINVGSAVNSTGSAGAPTIDLDSSGAPFVAFPDGSLGNKATVMKFNGTTWELVGLPGFSTGATTYTKILVDDTGTPYLTFADGANSNKATVMKFNGGAWNILGNPAFSTGASSYNTIVMDTNSIPYVAYRDGGIGNKACVMKYDGSAWIPVGGVGISSGLANHVSIAIGIDQNPYITYSDGTLSNRATVLKYDGSTWNTVGNPGFTSGAASNTCIAIDNSGNPYVAFRDVANGSKATVMKYIAGNWDTVGAAGFSPSWITNIYLAVNPDGIPYVVYKNVSAWVYKYSIPCIQPTIPTLLTSSNTNCGTHNTTLSIDTGSLNDATHWQWYSNSCDGFAVGSGSSIIVSPSTNTTYFVRGEGGCASAGACANISITVDNPLTWYLDIDNDSYYSSTQAACTSPGLGWTSIMPIGGAGDCAESNATINPGALEICNGLNDDCDGQTDEGCSPPALTNDNPATASNVAYSSNMNYPNCYPITGTTMLATDSPESSVFSGPDTWYKFIAQSTAASITLTSSNMDDAIALYSFSSNIYTLIDSENESSGIGDFERMNVSNLIPGNTYYISVGAVSSSIGGTFSLCIQNLMPSGCANATPITGYSLCQNFKASYHGSASYGVSYSFSFTGTGGGALGTTTISGTNGLIPLSNPILALRYGGIYNVQVDILYALLNSASVLENITVNGDPASANCTGVFIKNAPLLEVKSSQRCPASLFRSNYLIATPAPGNFASCGATSYTYELTSVSDCTGLNALGLPFEVNTPGNTPYLPLAIAFPNLLPNSGYWKVRVHANFAYGSGSYGSAPFWVILVTGTSASASQADEQAYNQNEKSTLISGSTVIYPNPCDGNLIQRNLITSKDKPIHIRVIDGLGNAVYSNTYVTDGSLYSQILFDKTLSSGVYLVEITLDDIVQTHKLIVTN